MTFAELKQELADRGFSFLSDARLGRYINQARAELDESDLWPYREASVVGSAPLAIPDLGTIEAVVDVESQPLHPADYRDLLDYYGDLSTAGSATHYYIASPGGTLEVATFPMTGEPIGVQYWKITPELSAPTDTPVAPSRYHKIIVDMAVREAYRDSDNHGAAEQLQSQIDRDLVRMRETVLVQTAQGPVSYVHTTVCW